MRVACTEIAMTTTVVLMNIILQKTHEVGNNEKAVRTHFIQLIRDTLGGGVVQSDTCTFLLC